jgi:hypothetical protein
VRKRFTGSSGLSPKLSGSSLIRLTACPSYTWVSLALRDAASELCERVGGPRGEAPGSINGEVAEWLKAAVC